MPTGTRGVRPLGRHLAILLDGVDYLAGHREELQHCEPTERAPSRAAAEEALRAFLAALTGRAARLRAGWAAVRWVLQDASGARWDGPAWMFAFEAPQAGEFQLVHTGEDAEDWPAPELPPG